ncbi:hypothetical protein BJF95_22170 [Rhizobium oryziradicis]|uniref:Uncharacterized protein n=1 Tax=Rhizobium oryziradicis TaxID=1867956 RepID=A0A1Q8ZP22_9HYPH|nr:hypothetical protein BJF95_22170 [Rhizobium oryziradicis]
MQQRIIPLEGNVAPEERKRPLSFLNQGYLAQRAIKAKSSFVPEALQRNLFELRNLPELRIQFFKGLAAIEHVDIAVSEGLTETQNFLRHPPKRSQVIPELRSLAMMAATFSRVFSIDLSGPASNIVNYPA